MPHLCGRVRRDGRECESRRDSPTCKRNHVSLPNARYHGKTEFVAAWSDHGSVGGVSDADFALYHKALCCAKSIGVGDPSYKRARLLQPTGGTDTDYDRTPDAESG